MVAEEIKNQIRKALKTLNLPLVEFVVEHPEDEKFGDYSSNVALKLYQQLQKHETNSKSQTFKSPTKIAEKIQQCFEFRISNFEFLDRVEVAGQGFINYWLSEHFLLEEIKRAVYLGERYGTNTSRRGKKIMVEFTDPNPFKEFHIGHLYSNIVGESLSRLFGASGATVKRANYQGDVGLHVAKALYGLLQISNLKSQISKLEMKPPQEKAAFLGKSYALGTTAYEKDKNAKEEIEKLNQQIYAQDPEVMELYEKGRQWSLDYFETIYERLGTKFDFYYFERDAGKIGLDVVQRNLKKGIFQKSRGAVIFPGEKHGLHTRVFITSRGLPTYEAKDLGLVSMKYKDFSYDESVIVTGHEVDEYFRVVLAAMRLVHPELGEKTQHVSHGMVRLAKGKMSSRTGEVLTGEWLLDEAKKEVEYIIKGRSRGKTGIDYFLSKHPDYSSKTESEVEEIIKQISEVIGLGAVKYALLKSSIGRDIAFDFDESVSFEGNSGPYLQYTFARAKSVLRKFEARNSKHETNSKAQNSNVQNFSDFDIRITDFNEEELAILRWLYRYPEVVLEAGEEYLPSVVCGFLYELAKRYNTFYNKHRILNAKSKGQRQLRLTLTAATARVIKNGLFLLGIQAPRKM